MGEAAGTPGLEGTARKLLTECWLWKRGAAHPGKAKEPGLVFLALS